MLYSCTLDYYSPNKIFGKEMERSKPIEIISVIISVITLALTYHRLVHDKEHDKRQQRLMDLQAELHKEQIADLKESHNG
jgi:hypothetical protein